MDFRIFNFSSSMKKILFLFFLLCSIAATAQSVVRMATASGTNTYACTFNPAITSLNTSTVYLITFTFANTSSDITLDPAGVVAATPIKNNAGNPIPIGGIKAGGAYSLIFDGNNLKAVEITDGDNTVTWITKTANYSPVLGDAIYAKPAFSMRSVNALSFTIPPSSAMDFPDGQQFRVQNDSTGILSILEGAGVDFTCITAGPWTLEENEYAILTKSNSTNTWTLELFRAVNISEQTSVALFTETDQVGNVTTGEDILFTDTIPGNTLSTDGSSIRGRFSGIVANNANVKTIRLKLDATAIATRGTTTPTIGQGWTMYYEIIRTSETTQKTNVTFSGSDGIASSYYVATTSDLSGDVVIQLTGDATATNDIIMHTATGTFEPGAGGVAPPPVEPPEIPFVIVDDRTIGTQGYQFDYAGVWQTPCLSCAGWYDLTLSYTSATNATAEITFNGTRIQLYTEKTTTHGIMEISLDGVVVDTVDLYSASQLLQELVFDTGDAFDEDNEEGPLTQAVHTLTLRCTGTKHASSSNVHLILDYVKIENPEAVPEDPDPEPTYTHFVSTTGSNGGANNCETEGTPCLTITYMLTQMVSGDVGFIADGTYTEASYLVINTGESLHGESTNGTIIKVTSGLNHNVDAGAVDQTKCIMQLTAAGSTAQTISYLSIEGNAKLVHGGIYIDNDRNNVTLDNVKISNFDYFGAYVGGNDHTFTNVQIINSAEAHTSFSTGNLMITTSEDFVCDNVDISDNAEAYGVKAWGAGAIIESHIFRNGEIRVVPTSPYAGGSVPNIAYELHNAKPRNCRFENNYLDNSLSIIRPTNFANDAIPSIVITNNVIDMITKGAGGTTAIGVPIELGVHNAEISHNHMVGGRFAFIVHWNASETQPAINWDIYFNTFYYTGGVNLPTAAVRSSYAPLQDVDIFNNTFHIPTGMNFSSFIVMTGQGSVGEASSDVNIINNVIYDQSTADTGVGGANAISRLDGSGGSWTACNFTYNTIVGMSSSLPAGWTSNNTLTSGPSFIGGGGVNPSPFIYDPFYRPAVGSPLLNSGVDVGLGTPVDRGRIQVP